MMASLDDKIAALETEIAEYRMSSQAAKTSEERKDKLIDLMTESKKTLNILLAQKSQQQGK
jgi:hypothetical protein